MAVVVWLAIYPTITLPLAILGPQIAPWPLPLRTLVLTGIAVPLMAFVLLPGCSARSRPGCGAEAQPLPARGTLLGERAHALAHVLAGNRARGERRRRRR